MANPYKVTKTVNALPAVSVTLAGSMTYAEFRMSLGAFVFRALRMYMQSTTTTQITKQLQFYEYDANGNTSRFPVDPSIDPYQNQPALNIDLSENNVTFDGRLTFDLELEPGEEVKLIFYTLQLSAGTLEADDYDFFASFSKL